MATYKTQENEAETSEERVRDAEISLAVTTAKKDRKERRKIIKQILYDGSNKLKHLIPKGKHL